MLVFAISLITNCAELHILSVFPCHTVLCRSIKNYKEIVLFVKEHPFCGPTLKYEA